MVPLEKSGQLRLDEVRVVEDDIDLRVLLA